MEGCSCCCNLSVPSEIKTPEELRITIRKIHQSLRSKVLVEIENSANQKFLGVPPFEAVEEEGPWHDFLSHYFQCTYCQTHFLLHVETYNGSGGSWEPFSKFL